MRLEKGFSNCDLWYVYPIGTRETFKGYAEKHHIIPNPHALVPKNEK